MTDAPHWAKQGRSGDGRFLGFIEPSPTKTRALPGKFGGEAPAPSAEDATWLTKPQRQRLERHDPGRHKPYEWGGSAGYDAADEAFKRGIDPDAAWRQFRAVDPIPGRSPEQYIKEAGEPLLYLPDKDWSRQDGLTERAREQFKSGRLVGPLDMFSADTNALVAGRTGDVMVDIARDRAAPRGTSGGAIYPSKHTGRASLIDGFAGNLEDLGQLLRHENDHGVMRNGAVESGGHPFEVPGNRIQTLRNSTPGPTAGLERRDTASGAYVDALEELTPGFQPGGAHRDVFEDRRRKSAETSFYVNAPEEFRVLQGDQLARVPRGDLRDVNISKLDPTRLDPNASPSAVMRGGERQRVIEFMRGNPDATIDDALRHIGLPTPGGTSTSARDVFRARLPRILGQE